MLCSAAVVEAEAAAAAASEVDEEEEEPEEEEEGVGDEGTSSGNAPPQYFAVADGIREDNCSESKF